MNRYLLYCDGSCLSNPGPGGWAYRIRQNGSILRAQSGSEARTTNNQMELRAAIEGLRTFDRASEVVVLSDSRYLITGMTELLPLWKARNWRSSNGPAIQNQALWQELVAVSKPHNVTWKWVKGHSGVPDQKFVDLLAGRAAATAAVAA